MINPPFLSKNDKVALIGLASGATISEIDYAIKTLNNWGLQVIIGQSVGQFFNNFSGTDEIRSKDFQDYLNNPEINAIFSIRGGYGSTKIIDDIKFESLLKHPKWIIGFSDITAVHLAINAYNIQSIHGPMPKTFGYDEKSTENLRKLLFGKSFSYDFNSDFNNKPGSCNGIAIGGNLCMLAHNIGSKYDLPFDGKILLIEDVSEYLYNIDRMFVQLKRANKLDNLAGLIIGSFTDLKENDAPFGKNIHEIILEHTSKYTYPIAFGFEFVGDDFPTLVGIEQGEVRLAALGDAARFQAQQIGGRAGEAAQHVQQAHVFVVVEV